MHYYTLRSSHLVDPGALAVAEAARWAASSELGWAAPVVQWLEESPEGRGGLVPL
jgi:hypothetical protein